MLKYIFSKKLLSLALAALMVLSFAACRTADVPDEAPESSVAETTPTPTEDPTPAPTEEPEESTEASQEPESSAEEEEGELFLPKTTENEAFNELFAENDIDAAYYEVATNSGSTTAIVRASNKAAGQWQTVIENAYIDLEKIDSGAKADYDAWHDSVDGKIQEIKDNAGSDGLANVTVSYEIMMFYRSKAGMLLEQIYNETGSFDLTVTAEAVG